MDALHHIVTHNPNHQRLKRYLPSTFNKVPYLALSKKDHTDSSNEPKPKNPTSKPSRASRTRPTRRDFAHHARIPNPRRGTAGAARKAARTASTADTLAARHPVLGTTGGARVVRRRTASAGADGYEDGYAIGRKGRRRCCGRTVC
jgi:hypothetical protein